MREIKELKAMYEKKSIAFDKESKRFSNYRLIIALLIVGIVAINYRKIFTFPYIIIFIALIIGFIFAVIKEGTADKNKQSADIIVEICTKYEQRRNGEWKNFESTGVEFEKEYAFLADLQILGENSLFQFINCCTTHGGKKKLARKFNKNMEDRFDNIKEEAISSQKSIDELCENKELILQFQEKIKNIEGAESMIAENEIHTFDMERKFSKMDFGISLVLSFITIILAFLSKNNVYCLMGLIPMIFIQFVSAVLYQNAYGKEISATGKHLRKLTELKSIYQLFQNKSFQSSQLEELKNKIIVCQDIFVKLKKIDTLESFRKNFIMWFIGNVFLSLNRFIVKEYGNINENDRMKMYQCIDAIEDLEVLISLASINIVKEHSVKPTFSDEMKISCKNAIHPMLDEEICIGNDFETGKNINIITGSNMSGKTSFMKTIGVNLVLAYSGAYVNATEFHAPIMKIFTSINVKDDINKGISKFYAELLRLKEAMNSAKSGEKIILFVDEIFSGTNYQDRIFGAKNIINKLSDENVIGFITTHDFELCEINNSDIVNYHFSEEYDNGKMKFSHKIKEGECQGTNAIQLMEETGIL